MTDAKGKMIVNKATGKLYPVTEEIRGFIADHIKELLEGHRPTSIVLHKRLKRVGLDNSMTFRLFPESSPKHTDIALATIHLERTGTYYYVSEVLRQLIIDRIDDLLAGKRVGPLLFEGILNLDLYLDQDMRFILTKSE